MKLFIFFVLLFRAAAAYSITFMPCVNKCADDYKQFQGSDCGIQYYYKCIEKCLCEG